ncbi:MAG: glycosyltransferase family 4 protein [Vicingaceae bacterium]
MKKLAIVSSHPIQYNAPLFRLLAASKKIELYVFYTAPQFSETFFDPDFGNEIKWDIPLLEGYDYQMVENISPHPSTKHWNGIICPNLIPSLQSFAPDAILIFGWKFKSHFAVMRHFSGKTPIWFRGDSTNLDAQPFYKKFVRNIVLRFVFRYVDRAFYVGKANKSYYQSAGLDADSLILAPHAVDNDFFAESEEEFNALALQKRKELGFTENDLVVLFAGKFEKKKNPGLLLDAFKEAIKHRQNLRLLFVGNGDMERELRRGAEGLDQVKFLAFQNQRLMPVIYRTGDILCLPSRGPNETWGLAANEAMASGRPVILSNAVGSFADLVDNHHNGFIFDHTSRDELTAILTGLDKKLTVKMGEEARISIKKFSFSTFSDQVENELNK